jgi:uncharacterized membrane protein
MDAELAILLGVWAMLWILLWVGIQLYRGTYEKKQ